MTTRPYLSKLKKTKIWLDLVQFLTRYCTLIQWHLMICNMFLQKYFANECNKNILEFFSSNDFPSKSFLSLKSCISWRNLATSPHTLLPLDHTYCGGGVMGPFWYNAVPSCRWWKSISFSEGHHCHIHTYSASNRLVWIFLWCQVFPLLMFDIPNKS